MHLEVVRRSDLWRRRALALAIAALPLMPAGALGAEYGATYSFPPFRVCPSKDLTIPVTVTNTGTRTWGGPGGSGGGNPRTAFVSDISYLTYHLENTKTGITAENVQPTFLPHAVPPGQSITLDMRIVGVPLKGGPYVLHWDMGNFLTSFSAQGVPTGDVPLQFASSIACLTSAVERVKGIPRDVERVRALIIVGPDEVTPGMMYLLSGFEFGATPGSVSLTSSSFTGGPLALQIVSWSDTDVGVKVPDRCGEVDQDAEIRLTTAAGDVATYLVRFVATREARILEQDIMQVASCANPDAGRHRCKDVGNGPIGAADLSTRADWAVTGQHQCLGFNVQKTDEFSVTLLNGWKIVGVYPCLEADEKNPDFDFCPGGPGYAVQMAHSADHVTVEWKTGVALDAMGYLGKVTIKGPCGTPHR